MNVGALRNLKTVEIIQTGITDDVVFQLASGLVALECLVLFSCRRLQCIQISSYSLKEFHIRNCSDLKKVTIDAPNLIEFWYKGGLRTLVSLIRVQDCCNAHFLPCVDLNNTFWFFFLKKFLMESNIFRFLVIDLPMGSRVQITVLEDVLKSFDTGAPYELRELKLREIDDRCCDSSTLTALVDGLFWSCRPEVLSITTSFGCMVIWFEF